MHADAADLSMDEAAALKNRVRAALELPDSVPIVVLARGWKMAVQEWHMDHPYG